jgi:hypothetical protein
VVKRPQSCLQAAHHITAALDFGGLF